MLDALASYRPAWLPSAMLQVLRSSCRPDVELVRGCVWCCQKPCWRSVCSGPAVSCSSQSQSQSIEGQSGQPPPPTPSGRHYRPGCGSWAALIASAWWLWFFVGVERALPLLSFSEYIQYASLFAAGKPYTNFIRCCSPQENHYFHSLLLQQGVTRCLGTYPPYTFFHIFFSSCLHCIHIISTLLMWFILYLKFICNMNYNLSIQTVHLKMHPWQIPHPRTQDMKNSHTWCTKMLTSQPSFPITSELHELPAQWRRCIQASSLFSPFSSLPSGIKSAILSLLSISFRLCEPIWQPLFTLFSHSLD